ncbi:hypothetical protein TNCV_5111071 [Trichonephila clavipes]|nr:hypothetical protein TNCV_5111071 [Trichonephila clavipes]
MYDPSSFANPTPLAHADTSRDVLPRGGLGTKLTFGIGLGHARTAMASQKFIRKQDSQGDPGDGRPDLGLDGKILVDL